MRFKIFILIFLLALGGLGFIFYRQFPRPPIEPLPSGQSDLEREEYAVYSAIIKARLVQFEQQGQKVKLFVVENKTGLGVYGAPGEATSLEESLNSVKEEFGLVQEVIDDFRTKNKTQFSLNRKFNLDINYYLPTDEETKRDSFYNKYSDSNGIMSFSRIGFDSKNEQALVLVGEGYGRGLCEGNWIYLIKKNGTWELAGKLRGWVC